MASLYPTVTEAEFSKLSARLQQAILQRPANEIISFLTMPSRLTKLPLRLPSTTTSSNSTPSALSANSIRSAPFATCSVSFTKPRYEATKLS